MSKNIKKKENTPYQSLLYFQDNLGMWAIPLSAKF